MIKSTIVLVLALVVFQASNGETLQNVNNNSEVFVNEIHETINEINKFLVNLTNHISKLTLQLADKFEALRKEANFSAILSQLKKNIASASVSKSCSSAAQYKASLLQKLVDQSVLKCRMNIDLDADKLQELRKQVQNLLEVINHQVFKCFRDNFGSFGKFAKCMESTLEAVRVQMKQVRLAVEEALDVLENNVPLLEEQVENCVREAKEEIQTKAQRILDDMKTCSKDRKAMKRQLCWPDFMMARICNEPDYF